MDGFFVDDDKDEDLSIDEDFALALQLQQEWQEELDQECVRIPQHDSVKANSTATPDGTVSLVDPSWELIDPHPDIRSLFLQFNDKYFWSKLLGIEVKWSPRMTVCAGLCCYEGRGGLCSVKLSQPLLKLRPRKDLVETLLHEMIHAYLFVTDNNKDHDGHGPEFHKHMYRINKLTGTSISVYHNFHDEVNSYRTHWWRCEGVCRTRKPFYGYVKRSMNRSPAPRDTWWPNHQATCGGTFVKIKEPEGYGTKKGKASKDNMTEPSTKTTEGKLSNQEKAKGNNMDIRIFAGQGNVLGSKSLSSKSSILGKEANSSAVSIPNNQNVFKKDNSVKSIIPVSKDINKPTRGMDKHSNDPRLSQSLKDRIAGSVKRSNISSSSSSSSSNKSSSLSSGNVSTIKSKSSHTSTITVKGSTKTDDTSSSTSIVRVPINASSSSAISSLSSSSSASSQKSPIKPTNVFSGQGFALGLGNSRTTLSQKTSNTNKEPRSGLCVNSVLLRKQNNSQEILEPQRTMNPPLSKKRTSCERSPPPALSPNKKVKATGDVWNLDLRSFLNQAQKRVPNKQSSKSHNNLTCDTRDRSYISGNSASSSIPSSSHQSSSTNNRITDHDSDNYSATGDCSGDAIFIGSPESERQPSNAGDNGSSVACPVCGVQSKESEINQHLDRCLQ